MGHELDYKTVNDWLFLDHAKSYQGDDLTTIHKILKKLITIQDKRFPQLFFIFSQNRAFLQKLASKICSPDNEQQGGKLNECLSMLIKLYMKLYVFHYNWKLQKGFTEEQAENESKEVFEEMGELIEKLSIKQ